LVSFAEPLAQRQDDFGEQVGRIVLGFGHNWVGQAPIRSLTLGLVEPHRVSKNVDGRVWENRRRGKSGVRVAGLASDDLRRHTVISWVH
jgi:hypothetical protein